MASPNQIEAYLSGTLPYAQLTDAERCAICSLMETGRSISSDLSTRIIRSFNSNVSNWAPDYLNGTATLRLVERFSLSLVCWDEKQSGHAVHQSFKWMSRLTPDIDEVAGLGSTPAAAIVNVVCELAKMQWSSAIAV